MSEVVGLGEERHAALPSATLGEWLGGSSARSFYQEGKPLPGWERVTLQCATKAWAGRIHQTRREAPSPMKLKLMTAMVMAVPDKHAAN